MPQEKLKTEIIQLQLSPSHRTIGEIMKYAEKAIVLPYLNLNPQHCWSDKKLDFQRTSTCSY